MKVSLVVASGAHQGKAIPIAGAQFLIGRDAGCHLRPASQAISKRHCGLLIRDGKVLVKDFGSTNGTTVNGEVIKGIELEVEDGATLQLGPLDFTIRIEQTAEVMDGTPLPQSEGAAALAAVKATTTPKAPARDATPNPNRPARPTAPTGSKESPALTGSKEAAALKTGATAKPPAKPQQPAAPKAPPAGSADDDNDKMAAMLLEMDSEGGDVPDGSTVMEMPAAAAPGEAKPGEAKPGEGDKKKVVQSREDMSNAANDILRKMMRRPK